MAHQTCEFPDSMESDDTLRKVLEESKTIAVVGLSTDHDKPANYVPTYLKSQGYIIIPVHPKADILLGERVYRTLDDIPFSVDLVEIFRPSADIPPIVDAAIRINAKAVWMQQGLAHHEAAENARAAGLTVLQNRCMMVEHKRLIGEKD
jgi:uncharacterized protein